ncbi:MAG: transcription-repair coupling factor, partial [Alphaproteobacteria bacterium]|nr:transcription-repair coupling factor [Alphaproteobacteria bacterium]
QQARCEQIAEYYQARHDFLTASKTQKNHANIYKPIPTSWLYWPADDVEKTLSQHVCITLSPFADEGGKHDAGARAGADFAAARQQGSRQLYEAVKFYLAQQKTRVIMACHSAGSRERLSKTFSEQHIVCAVVSSLGAARQLPEKTLALGVFNLAHGFRSANMTIITEQDMMGDRLARREKKKRASEAFQLELSTLAIGDLLVHAEHGIGRYDGLLALDVLGAPHDCIKLLYQGGDKLFVPVENMDLLSRYGSDTSEGALDKLGGAGWQQRKARVKKRLKDMADALMKVAAARAAQQGEVMDAPEGLYEEFSARFPYVETDDQARAIDAVRDDLSSGKPMDRLVCGDVGFGKTEVALRAAFIAAQAGMQVAVLVPTTLLARQHYQNFSKRFAGLPFKIAQLSRFISALDAKKIKADLQEGKIDVVIGTHALLTKDLSFKNLGLLIVDEEQHFGVKQKERLKELKNNVHILTLSATPIPRTLQLSLAGVRDLSLITTPPIDRLAVHSFVLPYDPMIIRQAIMREHFRGGQVFYVCPRIEDLEDMTKQLAELVPEVRIVMAHGRMPPAQLDDIMTAFDSAEFDVLLSTNIVESGLDIPNANTMIIHRADMFGLSQLYQLRGRVGRGKQRAYAYFTYAQTLNEMAQRRLEIIQTLDQLGAGFQLASHDMDLRGAGNLLGEEQSGHIREVGVELYQQMLEDAVNNAKQHGENIESDWTPQINLGLSVLIPEKYVADLNVRLALYRRASQLADGALKALDGALSG